MNNSINALTESSSSNGPPPIIDPCAVLSTLDTSPGEVIVGGSSACFTVTGLKVTSTRDAMMIFEACRRGILPRVIRRLHEAEKQMIDAGTIVVFDEREAKMKRWTDGRLWTPSRIVNNFLLYRELDQKIQPGQEGAAEVGRWAHNRHPASFGSRKGVFLPKEHGLIKRIISLSVPDNETEYLQTEGNRWRAPSRTHQQHLIAYSYTEGEAQLPAPDDMEELQFLRLPLLLLKIQKFRRPIRITMRESDESGDYDMVETDDDEESDAARRSSGRRVYGALDPSSSSSGLIQPSLELPLSSPVHQPPPGALPAVNNLALTPHLPPPPPELIGPPGLAFNPDLYSAHMSISTAPVFAYDSGLAPGQHSIAPYYDFTPTGDVMFGAAGEHINTTPVYSHTAGLQAPPPEYMDALYGLQQQHYHCHHYPVQQPHARVFQEHQQPVELTHPQATPSSHVRRPGPAGSSQ
ncbi:Global transcription regulator sge1 [Coemansia pectinata]|uniref:Global transcription regulator sge1 n=1 Tax=Coemansia pectinata TaxID=1052879 RepID=A0A9W8H1Y5_9FUNG|nr:Global transcription regulator sge1 [Coemansia pectinata]